jgi:hypothetical protein
MRIANILRFTVAVIATVLLAGTVQAQLFRAYLAPTGSDASPCTLPTPCRLLPAALAAVADGGEIWMLGSANYNVASVNITKSVSILAVPGVVGSVVATNGPAISIATVGVKVALRNLVIAPLPGTGGTDGIVMTNGAALTVENCLIANLPGSGIHVDTASRVQVTDTTIRDNGNYGLWLLNGVTGIVARATITGNVSVGISVQSTGAGTTTVDIASSTVGANSDGVGAQSGAGLVKVSIRDSQIVQNLAFGLFAGSGAASATLLASNNTVSQSNYGMTAVGAGTKIWATGNTVSDNGVGLTNNGAVFESAGNNAVRNNGVDKDGTITVVTTE